MHAKVDYVFDHYYFSMFKLELFLKIEKKK